MCLNNTNIMRTRCTSSSHRNILQFFLERYLDRSELSARRSHTRHEVDYITQYT
jgi:hypothetical protein